jgi:TRAP transporter 4TM/12TM fusion protein
MFKTGRRRIFGGPAEKVITILAALFALWVVYANLFVISDRLVIGILFVCGILTLLFLTVGGTLNASNKPSPFDWALTLLSAACGVYFFFTADTISNRISLLEPFTAAQFGFGTALLLLTLEATRRTTGLGLTLVVLAFLGYNWLGSRLPAPFNHGITEFSYLLDVLVFTTDGVFGVPVQVVASYVFLFVMFGSLLAKAGGGEFFFNLAAALTGRTRGGPAKIAVISSGMYGTISGSATSDVVTTGSITIPMMKRLGYSGRFAGAVEVAASTGGSTMPPIMGSAAFILAEYTAVPYRDVIYAALLPALAYYLGVFTQVHLRAVRHDLRPIEGAIPTIRETLVSGWVFILPIATIVAVLILGYSPTMTAGLGAAAVVVAVSLTTRTRLSPWAIIEALGDTTMRILPVAAACAAAGLVIGGLSMTGLGMKAANLILLLSGGDAVATLLLAALITIILGLGMPTPSAYVLAAVLVAPALTRLGFPMLESHLFLLYYAILSALTPPIAVAAMAAAAIADDDPFLIAFDAVKLASVGFLMPFVFLWNPAFVGQGDMMATLLVIFGAALGTVSIAIAVEGIILRSISRLERLLLLPAAALSVSPDLRIAVAGMLLVIVLVGRRVWSGTKAAGLDAMKDVDVSPPR